MSISLYRKLSTAGHSHYVFFLPHFAFYDSVFSFKGVRSSENSQSTKIRKVSLPNQALHIRQGRNLKKNEVLGLKRLCVACRINYRQTKLLLTQYSADAIFPFVNGGFPLKQSLPFPTTVYCRFHEEDKVLIAEIQLILTLTLSLIHTKINFKRTN